MTIVHSRLFTTLKNFYPSTCAIQEGTETLDGAGQTLTSWANKSGHTAIACRVSPSGGTERKTPTQIWSVATHVIELGGNYPLVTVKMRALVSSVYYDILLVEHDGNVGSTRLVCEVVK
jgi:hypothetical protein